jgi:hypothetical protein
MKMEETIAITLQQLFEMAETNKGKNNIDNAVGEITIAGVEYQMQVSLIADKKLWAKSNEVRFSEVVKVH